MDTHTRKQRSYNMSRIRSKDTTIEVQLRSILHRRGLRFRKNVKSLKGKPDIVFPAQRVAVFIDSCFWHKCPYHFIEPTSNRKYWIPKLDRNKLRDREVNKILRRSGWTVMRIWEHSIIKDIEKCADRIENKLSELRPI